MGAAGQAHKSPLSLAQQRVTKTTEEICTIHAINLSFINEASLGQREKGLGGAGRSIRYGLPASWLHVKMRYLGSLSLTRYDKPFLSAAARSLSFA